MVDGNRGDKGTCQGQGVARSLAEVLLGTGALRCSGKSPGTGAAASPGPGPSAASELPGGALQLPQSLGGEGDLLNSAHNRQRQVWGPVDSFSSSEQVVKRERRGEAGGSPQEGNASSHCSKVRGKRWPSPALPGTSSARHPGTFRTEEDALEQQPGRCRVLGVSGVVQARHGDQGPPQELPHCQGG